MSKGTGYSGRGARTPAAAPLSRELTSHIEAARAALGSYTGADSVRVALSLAVAALGYADLKTAARRLIAAAAAARDLLGVGHRIVGLILSAYHELLAELDDNRWVWAGGPVVL